MAPTLFFCINVSEGPVVTHVPLQANERGREGEKDSRAKDTVSLDPY